MCDALTADLYRQLIADLAAGNDVPLDRVLATTLAAGRTLSELEADVDHAAAESDLAAT